MTNARDYLIALYLDYTNNYLTLTKFAEHSGLHEDQARQLLAIAQNVFNSDHPEA
jgi:hypothetical protein